MNISFGEHARRALTDDEYKYLKILSLCPKFVLAINHSCKILGTPPYSINEDDDEKLILPGKPFNLDSYPDIDDYRVQKKSRLLAVQILDDLEMPVTLYPAVEYIILLGSYIATIKPVNPINIYNDDILLINEPKRVPFPIIQLNKRISESELIAEIKAQWPKIDKSMNRFDLLSKRKPIQHISIKDIDSWCLIHRLKKKNTPYEEIREKLESNGTHMETGSIGRFYTRYLPTIKKHFPL